MEEGFGTLRNREEPFGRSLMNSGILRNRAKPWGRGGSGVRRSIEELWGSLGVLRKEGLRNPQDSTGTVRILGGAQETSGIQGNSVGGSGVLRNSLES